MGPEDVEIIAKETPFQGYFRIDRYRLRHRKHDGGWSGEMLREIFERGHAVGLLFYDPDRDEVGLIEQFRPGAMAAGWHPWLIEIVAGIIEKGETPEGVARRESVEEAGVEIDDPLFMIRYLVTPGGSTESMTIYLARVDATKLNGIHGVDHEHEDIRVMTLPYAEALAMVEDGRICNSMTVIALQWLALHKPRVLARWTGLEPQGSAV